MKYNMKFKELLDVLIDLYDHNFKVLERCEEDEL